MPQVLIGAAETARLVAAENGVPLDARSGGAFEAGHLPGGVPAWDLGADDAASIERVRSLLAERGITGDEAVILYGGSDREAVGRLFWLLSWAGCPKVYILEGGVAAWRAAGGALATGPSKRSPAARRGPVGTTAVDAQWVTGSLGQTGIEILDVRDARGWDQWRTPPTFGAGHIPRSLPFDPRALLPAEGGWPEPAELRRRLGLIGPRLGDPVRLESTFVLYGEDGRDPKLGLGYLLLTLAGLEARIFPGGWREWTAGGGRPVMRIVSAAEVAALLQREDPSLAEDRPPRGLVLLDLREERDFATGHLPGALNLPYRSFPDRFESMIEENWPGADRATLPLLLYCYGPECIRSREAGAQAARLGFREVLWFRGGVREWWAAELPLPTQRAVTAAPAPPVPRGAAGRR